MQKHAKTCSKEQKKKKPISFVKEIKDVHPGIPPFKIASRRPVSSFVDFLRNSERAFSRSTSRVRGENTQKPLGETHVATLKNSLELGRLRIREKGLRPRGGGLASAKIRNIGGC